MSMLLMGLAIFLVLNLMAGLIRVARGPTRADRMVAAQLFGTTGVALLLVLGQAKGEPALADIALVFALLAVVVAVAFVQRGWVRPADPEEHPASPGEEPK
jgi:multicomponent Na+:H+ antiporter subunit F